MWVTITPGQNSRAVAEHVFALALALARKIAPPPRPRPRDGSWSQIKAELTGFELHGRTLGLFGLGSIGITCRCRSPTGSGWTVIVTDPYLDDEQVAAPGGRKVDLDELLATADVISLHVPLTPATRHIIDAGAHRRDATRAPC